MLLPLPIQLVVEDLLPRAKVQLAICNGTYNLSSHDGSLQVSIGIILIAFVLVLAVGLLWCQFLKPEHIVLMQA